MPRCWAAGPPKTARCSALPLQGPTGETPWELMDRHGHLPLPPYIERQQNTDHDPDEAEDSAYYQTVFARNPGAVAAPTAAAL